MLFSLIFLNLIVLVQEVAAEPEEGSTLPDVASTENSEEGSANENKSDSKLSFLNS